MRLILFVCIVHALAWGYSANPPNGKTGAPGEGTCRDCHATFGLNSGPGTLTIAAPEEFAPGATYPIVITIVQSGPSRWGFEFTPLQVGTCAPLDPATVQVAVDGGKTYVKQTSLGTYAGVPTAAGWAFEWTAPPQPPDVVTFYACANAADNDGSPRGDYVYTASVQSVRAQGVGDGAPRPADARLWVWPNPSRDRVMIRYSLVAPAQASVRVYDAAGALVATLVDGTRPAGHWEIPWDARGAAPGLYLCRLSSNVAVQTRPVVIVH